MTDNFSDDIEKAPPRFRNLIGKNFSLSNKKSKDLLGIKYERKLEEYVCEMVRRGIEYGLIEDKINK